MEECHIRQVRRVSLLVGYEGCGFSFAYRAFIPLVIIAFFFLATEIFFDDVFRS